MQSYTHTPVLLKEVLRELLLGPGTRHVDGTLGGGGHAAAVLKAGAPDSWLGGSDRDGAALAAARERLAEYGGRCELRRADFSELSKWIGAASVDSVLLDLGVSSPQLDVPTRGFSFQSDGPLDMRMDDRQELTAERLVNESGEEELAHWIWKLGGERQSRRIARAIVREREQVRIETTGRLSALVVSALPRRGGRLHPATRVFQAIRMVVNNELELLQKGLRSAMEILKPGGRLLVITFHSAEARTVKEFGDTMTREEIMRWVRRKVVKASELEKETNPRARSAQLRVLEKI